MAPNNQNPRFRRILTKSLVALIIFPAALVILACLILAFLPTFLSTERATRMITDQLENALNHPVRIQDIDWTWTNGLVLSGIDIPDHPDFSDQSIIIVDRAALDFRFRDLLKRRLKFSFMLNQPVIHLVRNEAGKLNILKAFAGPETAKEAPDEATGIEPEPDKPAEPFRLPMDIATDIHLADVQVFFEDRLSDQHFSLQNGDIHIKAPSVIEQPAQASITAELTVNHQEIPRSTISAGIKNLFDSSREIRFDQVAAQVDASLPGTSVHLSGDMSDKGIKGQISLNLETIVSVAAPLMPGIFKETEIGGQIELTVEAAQAEQDIIDFETAIAGKKLSASGTLLNGNSLGPGDVLVSAVGQMNLKAYDLRLNRGELKLLGNSRLACQGRISGLNQTPLAINLAIAPVQIDLQEIAAFGKDFLPHELTLGQSSEDRTVFSVEKIHLNGHLPTGRAALEISNASLDASHLFYQTGGPESPAGIRLQNTGINIKAVKTILTDLMPASAEFDAGIGIGSMDYIADDTRLSLNKFALTGISLVADNIQIEDQSPLKISGNYNLSDTIEMYSLEFNELLKVIRMRQALEVKLTIDPDGTASGVLNSLSIKMPDIKFSDPSFGSLETNADLDLSLSELRLNSINNLDLDIRELAAQLVVGNMLDLSLNANAEQTGQKNLYADAAADIDLSECFNNINLKDLFKISAGGEAKLDIQISGKRPNSHQLSGLKALNLSDNLGFLDNCRIHLNLSNGAFAYQPDGKTDLQIGMISGSPLLSYELSGKTASGSLSSSTRLTHISNMLIAHPAKPAEAEISLTIMHQGAEQITGSQRLQIQPGSIDQLIEISLDGLESASVYKTPYEIFKRISGQVSAGIELPECQALKQWAIPGMDVIDLTGGISGLITVQKPPENKVDANIRVNVSDLSASMPEIFSLAGLEGGIEISKAVNIQKAGSALSESTSQKWLSQQIMRISGMPLTTELMPSPHINSSFNQFTSTSNPESGLSLESGNISAGGMPIAIGPSRISIELSQGLPGIDFLNLDILGGAFRGNLSIDRKSSGYFLESRLNFTGIDPNRIFPEAGADMQSGESEISGSLFASIPIARQMDSILENAEIHIDFRKIGSRALERLLYALDPYESNEAIVSQRRLLRMGSPRRIRLSIKDGLISLEGEVAVKSVSIAIPPLRRLNIAQLPGIKAYESSLSAIDPIIKILDLMTADTLPAERLFSVQ